MRIQLAAYMIVLAIAKMYLSTSKNACTKQCVTNLPLQTFLWAICDSIMSGRFSTSLGWVITNRYSKSSPHIGYVNDA